MRTISAWVWERPPPKMVEPRIPEMESEMINLKVLSTAAAIALVLPMVASSISAAQAQDRGSPAGGGGARAGGGGGAAIGGGGGGFRGAGGGSVATGGGGGFRGGGMAVAPGGGGGFRTGGMAAAPSGDRGFRAGAVAGTGGRGPGFVRPGSGVGGGAVAGGGYYGGGYRHYHHRGGGFWPGVAIGAGIGSAYAYSDSPYYYDDSYGYYDDSAVAEAPPAGDDSVAYCMQRYKSYDPASGTYLGYDGQRHPCPAQ